MRHPVLLIVAALLTVAGCAPQAELVKLRNEMGDVRAEVRSVRTSVPDLTGIQKRQDRLEEEIKGTTDLQQRMADQGARFDQLTMDLQLLQGKLEENNYRLKELSQKLDDRSFRLAEATARIEQLEAKLKSAPAPTIASSAETRPAAQTPAPSEAYQQAKADYDKGNFDLAIAGFENFLQQFPDTSLADSAQYWIGECYYSKNQYGKAIEAFRKVLKDHSKSDKAAGAKLKIGYSYLNEKNNAKAKEYLQKVVKDHPGSREADLAKEKLKKLGK